MSVNTFKYIHFAHYKDIPNWSVQYVVEEKLGFTKKYPMAKIGSFLKKSKNLIEIQDDVEYKQVTVKINNGGVIARNDGQLKKGSEIGTKRQTVVHAGQFIVSKIDARNGAFGVIPDDLEGAIVTNDFPVFDVDSSKILPQFMVLISTTPQFVEFARKCSSGTTNRKRIDIDAFLQQVIPLPSLEEQEDILVGYNQAIGKIEYNERQILSFSEEGRKLLDKLLKMKKYGKCKGDTSLRFIAYSSTAQRWDSFAVNQSIESDFPIRNLETCIKNIATGTTPSTNKQEYFKGNIKFYTPADIGVDKYLGKSCRSISDLAVRDNKARLFHKNDLLFVGIGSTVGKVGIVEDECVSSNQQITGLTVDESQLKVEYLYYYLKFNKDLAIADSSKTTLPIVNQEKIKQIPIVVPPLVLQEDIVEKMSEVDENIDALKKQIAKLKSTSLSEFEQTIFE